MSFNSNEPLQINQLQVSLDLPKKYEDAHEVLSLFFKRITDAVNKKEGSLYSLQEYGNFQSFNTVDSQTFKDGYRKVFDMVSLNGGSIANGVTVSSAHNITGLNSPALIYANCKTSDNRYFSVMGYSTAWLDNTNVNFTNSTGQTITFCNLVANYLKN